MNFSFPAGLGAIVALVVLILAVVFWAMHRLDPLTATLIGGLAVARLT